MIYIYIAIKWLIRGFVLYMNVIDNEERTFLFVHPTLLIIFMEKIVKYFKFY